MSRVRVWAPFLIGLLGGSMALLLEAPIGKFLGVYNPLFGYATATLYAGALIALVAALASRTWRGVLTLLLGFTAAGLPFGGLPAALYFGVVLSLFGVPMYAAILTVVAIVRGRGTRAGPTGWPPETSDSIPSEPSEPGGQSS